MNVVATPLAGLLLAQTVTRRDHRGEFSRLYCERDLASAIGARRVLQVNLSLTRAVGAVRGLHFQHAPAAEMKLVRCVRGRVWDVALDLRTGSPTFLRWHAQELSADNADMLVVPEGFAHGFQVLEPDSELLYLHTAFYDASREGGVAPEDPAHGIRWPLPVTDLSARDLAHPPIEKSFRGI
jgi:dTDP-4-dehydrorhamnose 3,5-epimerase